MLRILYIFIFYSLCCSYGKSANIIFPVVEESRDLISEVKQLNQKVVIKTGDFKIKLVKKEFKKRKRFRSPEPTALPFIPYVYSTNNVIADFSFIHLTSYFSQSLSGNRKRGPPAPGLIS